MSLNHSQNKNVISRHFLKILRLLRKCFNLPIRCFYIHFLFLILKWTLIVQNIVVSIAENGVFF